MTIDAGTLRIESYPRLSEKTHQKEAKNAKESAERNYAAQLMRLYDFSAENQGNFRPSDHTSTDYQDRFEPITRQLLDDVISARLEVAQAQERQITGKDIYSDERKPLDAEIRRCEGARGVVRGWRQDNADPLISLIHDLNDEARAMAKDRFGTDKSKAPWPIQFTKKAERQAVIKEADLMHTVRLVRIDRVSDFVDKNYRDWLAEKPQVQPNLS